jgi:SAM-dependent methyltransferase
MSAETARDKRTHAKGAQSQRARPLAQTPVRDARVRPGRHAVMAADNWAAGDAYEGYMGRWSRPLARAFVGWLAPPRGATWLEVGCGTGALTSAICDLGAPASVVACDPSESFVSHARRALPDERVSFVVGGADTLPAAPPFFDCVVSGLVLNFVADAAAAVRRMAARLKPGGVVGAYVWDYGTGMEFLRRFWDEAVALDPGAAALDEANRFPLGKPGALGLLFREAGLANVAVEGLEVPTVFQSFDDFWMPFLRGTGPAPSYATALSPEGRDRLRQRLADRLRTDAGRSVRLKARAWAAVGWSGNP